MVESPVIAMMNITGPIQSSLQPIQDNVEQFLKVNQRFAGEIINISNEQVVVSVNGIQIVAKMTSSEQLAMMMDRRYAYFVVKDISNNQVTLQLINNEQNKAAQKQLAVRDSLSQTILQQLGVPAEPENMQIVQTALNQGLKITPELLNDIKKVLDTLPEWKAQDVKLAVAMRAAGLPITEQSFLLAKNAVKDIKQNFISIYEQLQTESTRQNLPPQTLNILRDVLNTLNRVLIHGESPAEILEKNLSGSIKNLGASIENIIGQSLQKKGGDKVDSKMGNVLFSLANLPHESGNTISARLNSSIDNFIQGMRWMHFVNSEPDQPMVKDHWTQLDLPISFGMNNSSFDERDSIHNLLIKVAHQDVEETGTVINPNYTRLIIQVDLDPEELIKVDLSIVSNMVGAEITGSNDEICYFASEEMDDFQTGLSNIGYTLKTSRVEVDKSKMELGFEKPELSNRTISSIDLGV